ncbi:MAG: SsrA-binding protein SmpB [Chloroflexota bacterium]
MSSQESQDRVVGTNRKAQHDYFIDEVVETGIVLTGTEIKSVRAGRVSLRDAYAKVVDGEMWLFNSHISIYDHGNMYNHEPLRQRKLLLHRSQIRNLQRKTLEKGFTLVPLRVYLKEGLAKVALALARGRRAYDKREAVAEREAGREIERELARRG